MQPQDIGTQSDGSRRFCSRCLIVFTVEGFVCLVGSGISFTVERLVGICRLGTCMTSAADYRYQR